MHIRHFLIEMFYVQVGAILTGFVRREKVVMKSLLYSKFFSFFTLLNSQMMKDGNSTVCSEVK